MSHFMAEFLGTALLILIGDSTIANVCLKKSKAFGGGWNVIALGWGFGLMIPIFIFGGISGAHLNPALTISLAVIGLFPWAEVPTYIVAQFLGAFVGAVLVWLEFLPHWAETEDKTTKLSVFCTQPAIRNTVANFISEIIATFILVFTVLAIMGNEALGNFAPMLIGFVLMAIGMAMGGTTGYAINPARDLAPRIAHLVLPIAGKGDSDFGYAWIPVVAPIVGAIIAALTYNTVFI
ncbi:MIP/aquaporin family protein [Acetobacterium sp.]|uniref:MIP/aquaporin family protein n=1 Tax=Acetobacterium sp. TaxID=1872094 RepID=UPI0039C8697F